MRQVHEGGLAPPGSRPGLYSYLRSAWGFAPFAFELARLRLREAGVGTILGPVWLVGIPLLNALLFYVVFGLLLRVDQSVPHYPLFLLSGILAYSFFRQGVSAAAASPSRQSDLIRVSPFPRVVVPVSAFGVEVGKMLWSLVVLVPFTIFAVGVHWEWVIAVLGFASLGALALGIGLLLARLASAVPDILKVTPFVLRGLAFLSAVYFPLNPPSGFPPLLSAALAWNPVAVTLDVIRTGLEGELPSALVMGYSAGVSVAVLAIGLVVFWQGESRYGA